MRKTVDGNANEIREAVEDGKRRITRLAERGNALSIDG